MTKNSPLVSVLMTVYNREKYIAEAIESVLTSTYQNWELIIVDDQSKDRSVEITKIYAAKDARIKVYINEKNLGDYPNRNKAASYAKGKYIKYLDADDVMYPHALDVFVRTLEENPNAGIAICTKDTSNIPLPIVMNSNDAIREHFLKESFLTNSPLGTIIRKNAFEKVGGFSGKRHVGDTELWVKIANHYDVVKTVMGLGFWRAHDEQESLKEKTNINGKIIRFETELELIKYSQKYFSKEELKTLLFKAERRRRRYFFTILKELQFNNAIKYKKSTRISYIELAQSILP